MWSDNGGDPDPEQSEISKKYAWEYVAKLRDFYIYRSSAPEARELNTDPDVQALALNAVKKRARGSLITPLIILFIYPVVLTHGCFLLSTIALGTVWMILAVIFGLLMVVSNVRAFVHLKRIQKSLKREGYINSDTDWKKERSRYFSRKIVMTVLGIILICIFLRAWGNSVTDENNIPLDDYKGTIPFATIKDFAGDGCSDYSLTMSGLFSGINTVEEGSDWVAPRYIVYNEHAEIKRADGKMIDGGLYVEYCELRNPTLARLCAEEFYRLDRFKRRPFRSLDPLEAPKLEADYVVAYRNDVHFPTVIIQRGNIVVHADFYQTSSNYEMPLDEWAKIICDSINN